MYRFSKGICAAVNGAYCWPKLANVSALFTAYGSDYTSQVTVSQMDAACGDACINTMLVTLSSFGYPTLVAQVKAFQIFCLKIDGITLMTPMIFLFASSCHLLINE
jgi:hypothetical protein